MLKADMDKISIGTSGFSYQDWVGNFYPKPCPPRDFLRIYAETFKTVELDSTFYRIPSLDRVKRWKEATPPGFVFSAKFPQSVTHEGELKERISNLKAFVAAMEPLEEKLGPLLLQFAYGFKPDEHYDILEGLVDSLPPGNKYVVEMRNRKWLKPEFFELLKSRRICLCQIDHPWMPKKSEFTAEFLYIRFLGDRNKIPDDFSFERDSHQKELEWWSNLIQEFTIERGEVYGYFNNHYTGHSPTTARRLMEMLSDTK